MKTFEEKFTAWVDGRLTGRDLAAFEREMQAHPEALAEKEAALDVGNLLRAHCSPPPLQNPDFFNHQLLQQIRSEHPIPAPPPIPFWSLRGMAMSGALCLLLATGLYFTAVPNTRRQVRRDQQYVQNVLNAKSYDPSVSATSFHSKANNANVIWLDGLTYMPRDHKLK
jgi:anti-sigma factor RsiW